MAICPAGPRLPSRKSRSRVLSFSVIYLPCPRSSPRQATVIDLESFQRFTHRRPALSSPIISLHASSVLSAHPPSRACVAAEGGKPTGSRNHAPGATREPPWPILRELIPSTSSGSPRCTIPRSGFMPRSVTRRLPGAIRASSRMKGTAIWRRGTPSAPLSS